MNIQVNINAPELVEALNNLAGVLGQASSQTPVETKSAPKQVDTKKEDKPKADAKKDKPATTKSSTKPKKDEEPAKDEETEDVIPTPEELRAKAAELSKAGKKDEIKALINELGGKTLSTVPEDKRAELMEGLNKL